MAGRYFDLIARKTTLFREISGGATTFLTLSYILFVQPVLLSACGMDAGAVLVATCIASALGTLAMAVFTHYPIALAPAMGHNLFFAFTVCGVMGFTWQVALAANLVAGVLFTLLTLLGVQTALLRAVSRSMKNAIAVGIGMMIAFLGFQWAGLVEGDPVVLVRLADLGSPPALLALTGLGIIMVLMALKVRAAFLLGMVLTALIGLLATHLSGDGVKPLITYHGLVGPMPDLSPTLFQIDLAGLWGLGFLKAFTVVMIFLFLDVFDTLGTLIGVGEQAGLLKDGDLPRAKGAFLADSVGTVAGTLLGTSTVTSYVESAAGVGVGARTGVANLVTASLFILALFFSPLVQMISGGYPLEDGRMIYPVLAPVLILVGFLMIKNVIRIDWEEVTEGVPAFLLIFLMMLTLSVTEGIAIGFVSLSLMKLVSGKFRETSWIVHLMALLFLARWVFL